MSTGVEAFSAGLIAIGYEPVFLMGYPDHISIRYTVESGKFVGQDVHIGFIVPSDFPVTPPTGPHVSPHIHPLKQDGLHPTGAVHASPFSQATGTAWQYWSRPFVEWAKSRRTVAVYLSHIWRLWDSQ
jgi:hypothetical protein